MTRALSPAQQAQIAGFSDGRFPVRSLFNDKLTVVAQHICLVRIDVENRGKPARVAVNVGDVKDIDNLITALGAAKARLLQEQALLRSFEAKRSEAAS